MHKLFFLDAHCSLLYNIHKNKYHPFFQKRPSLDIFRVSYYTFLYKLKQRNIAVTLKNLQKKILACIIGSAILAFGLYNIHALSGVTEGGILGLTLLLHHWFGISPALSGFLLNTLCYAIGWKTLGRSFMAYSILSGCSFSVFYGFFEQFPPLWPQLAHLPLAAAVLGAVFVGVGVGLCVRAGGAPSGDDALAMSIGSLTGWDIRWAYLASDLIVLFLAASYLDIRRLSMSLLTVVLSGQIIGIVQKFKLPKR